MQTTEFLTAWGDAAYTSTSFFWMALWAFVLGYAISSMIQVFVTEERMQKLMGENQSKGVVLGTFFGFISSSCSFAALATTKSLFQKGASFVASIAYLLASTNLVIELGFIISIFLGWQFVVGEYVGGLLLILICWILIRIIKPTKLIKEAKAHLGEADENNHNTDDQSIKEKLGSAKQWKQVGHQYAMEWQMVWKDVTIGFTIAGIVSAFVPDAFFQTLFINTADKANLDFFSLLEHVVVGPLAAFMTFIGSMGNIPLAALLFGKGVSFAGVMAFIFSDLVVFPVLRINAKYYGWKMSFFILFLLFTSLLITSLGLHYGLSFFDAIPDPSAVNITEQEHFKIDYTFFLNLAFLAISGVLIYLGFFKKQHSDHHEHDEHSAHDHDHQHEGHGHEHHNHRMAPKSPILENILKYLAIISYIWLTVGLGIHFYLS